MKNLTTGRKAFFSVALALLTLTAIELLFQLFPEPPRSHGYRLIYNPELDFPKFYLKDKNLFWRLRPNQSIKSDFVVSGEYRTNASGFRDREFSEKRAAGKKRILCLGNSVTFGWRVAEGAAYPQALQKLLFDEYEVYNCAQTGYTTFQGERLLNELLQKYRPDAVTIAYIWNDILPAANGVSDSEQKMPPQPILSAQNLLARFAAYRWGRLLFLKLFSARPKISETPRIPLPYFRNYLQEMLDSCRAYNAQPVLVLPPAPKPEWLGIQKEPYQKLFYARFQQYAAEIKKLAALKKCSFVDADSALAGELSIWENLPEDFIHPSAQAHQKIARLLSNAYFEMQKSPAPK